MANDAVSRRDFVKGAAVAGAAAVSGAAAPAGVTKTRSYNPDMEYRRLGRTNLMVSVISLGGHWKKIPFQRGSAEFDRNRRDVIHACLDYGINYVDACCQPEVETYAKALGRRREEIYFGFDWTLARKPEISGSVDALLAGLDEGMKQTGLEYVDVWRLTIRELATATTWHEMECIAEAFDRAKQAGKARFTGVSTHHRSWVAAAVAKYPQLEVIITPYAAGSKEKPVGSMFDAFRRHDVGFIGIKPFASGSLFKSKGAPDSEFKAEDDKRARMALRHVLCCDVLAASIPGLITVDQVRNAVAAVKERREFDLAEVRHHDAMTREMWASLPGHYQWLRDWEYV